MISTQQSKRNREWWIFGEETVTIRLKTHESGQDLLTSIGLAKPQLLAKIHCPILPNFSSDNTAKNAHLQRSITEGPELEQSRVQCSFVSLTSMNFSFILMEDGTFSSSLTFSEKSE